MKSTVVKRSILVGGHKTSVSLEDCFWEELREIARARQKSISQMVAEIDGNRDNANLSSQLRLFVLNDLRNRVPDYKPSEA